MLSLGLFASLPLAMTAHAEQTRPRETLKRPSEFDSISNEAERSRAIFGEIGKLIESPRCMNCHPAGDHPLQGDDRHEHMPRVWRGETGHLATNCFGCHTERNVTLHEAASYQSIPGNPRWDVAPLSMAWEGKSLGDICRQLKDVSRNGGRDLAMLQEHIARDELVGWAWHPGKGRDPAPGDQETAGQWCRPGSIPARNVRIERRIACAVVGTPPRCTCGLRGPDSPLINVENELIDAQSKLDRPRDVF